MSKQKNLLNDLTSLLKSEKTFISDNGDLLIAAVDESARKLEPKLLRILKTNPKLKKQFFVENEEGAYFKVDDFVRFVNNKDWLSDDFTSFSNKIGLGYQDGSLLLGDRSVVLNWPYKDCILEGDMKKESEERKEVFYNEILAPDQVDRLLEPKVFANFKNFDKDGGHSSVGFIRDNAGIIKDNLIIRGNNLLVLHSLKKEFAGKIKLIYIDPPYNPDSKSNTFIYNNDFNESTWLTFMKNRLEVAKSLLTSDGVIVVAIDENEFLQLGVLLKEIFKNHETHCITIVHNPRGIQGTNFSYTNEFAFFVIPKGKKSIGNRKIEEKYIDWRNLRDNGGESLRTDAKNCFYPIITENGKVVGFGDVMETGIHPKSQTEKHGEKYYTYPIDVNGIERKWRYARQSVEEIQHLLRAKNTKNGIEIEIGKDFGSYRTVWVDPRYDSNEYGTKLVKSLVPNCEFDFPKSLWNVYDCLYAVVADDKDAIVLDFFAGSGTTAHAVLELNKDGGKRQFILCEQMFYVDTVTKERVRKVIEDKGAGSFVYVGLKENNEAVAKEIKNASSKDQITKLWTRMQETAMLSYRIDPMKFNENVADFEALSLEEQKLFLYECLEKNHLYVNLADIDDESFGVSEDEKRLNRSFYATTQQQHGTKEKE